MTNKIALIVLLHLTYTSNSQNAPSLKKDHGSADMQSVLLFTAGYKVPTNKSTIINSGHGIYLEAGINPGKLINENLTLGLFGCVAFKDRLWNTSFTNNFAQDYASSINTEKKYSQTDSAIIYSANTLFKNSKGRDISMPGCQSNSFHNSSLYYGILIQLPYPWLPGIKIYRGITKTHFQCDGNLITKNKEYNVVELERKMWGAEILFCHKLKHHQQPGEKKNKTRSIGASIYFENCNFSGGSLNFNDGVISKKIYITDFMRSTFLTKYKTEIYYGIKFFFSLS